jgi:hypothetical protein
MAIMFPGESAEYRPARDRLLEQEIELRRAMEAVAAAGGGCRPAVVPQDYAFQGQGPDGSRAGTAVELFARAGLAGDLQHDVPRDPLDERPGPGGQTALLPLAQGRARRARHCSISWTAPPARLPATACGRQEGADRKRILTFAAERGWRRRRCPRPGPPTTTTGRDPDSGSSRC